MAKEFYTEGVNGSQVLHESPTEQIPVYDDNDAAEADLANLEVGQIVATKQVYDYTVFDINYPIGVTYTQYPQQKSPNELWGDISTWEELDYSGAFFRSSGGNANGFATDEDTLSNCLQAQATAKNGLSISCTNLSHTHVQQADNSGTLYSAGRWTGSGYNTARIQNQVGTAALLYTQGATMSCSGCSMNHNHSLTGDSETRPTNYTVKIWVRTA